MRTHWILCVAATLVGCGSPSPTPADGGNSNDSAETVVEDAGPGAEDGLAGHLLDGDGVDPAAPPLAQRLEPSEVRAGVITAESELIGGPKADGRVGDIKLYNAHAAFVIEGVRLTSGYRVWGGTVVDADVIRPEGEPGEDFFGEYIPTWNLSILVPDEIEVVSDGADGVAHVRVSGTTGTFHWASNNSFVFFDLIPTALDVVYEYTLGPDDLELSWEMHVTNPDTADLDIELPFSLSIQGDGLFAWAPGGGYVPDFGGALPWVGGAGRSHAVAVLGEPDDFSSFFDYASIGIVQRQPYTIAGGETVTTQFHVAVTDQGPSGLLAARAALITGDVLRTVEGSVDLPDTLDDPGAWVAAWQGDEVVSMAPVQDDGTFSLNAPPEPLTLRAYALDHTPGPGLEVAADQGSVGALELPAAGLLAVSLDDGEGAPATGRVTVVRDGSVEPAGPPIAVSPWPRDDWQPGVEALVAVVDGSASVALAAGAYEVTASRGFDAELDTAAVTVGSGETQPVALSVVTVVDTTGYAAADFHVHASWSWDGHTPVAERAAEALAEGLHVPVLTEHAIAAGFDEVLDETGFSDRLAGPAGQEITSFIFGHFNAFPLVVDPQARNRGGVYPLDKEPVELFERMREVTGGPGAGIVQINHPRNPIIGGYLRYVGFDPTTGEVERTDDWTLDFDASEVFNSNCEGSENLASLDDWIALTNLGHEVALSSGSDSHSPGKPMGMPRNWLHITPEQARADTANIVAAVQERRMTVSCGPFVTVDAPDTVDTDGTATFDVRVQAPTWMSIDEVRLLENGIVVATEDLTSADPSAVVRFDGQLTATPAADAWYAVQVAGSGSMAPVNWRGAPFAMTNPFEVEVDGDGNWTAPGLP